MRAPWFLPLALLFAACSPRPGILILARETAVEYSLVHELAPMVASLEKAGFHVDVASLSGKKRKAGDVAFAPDLSCREVDLHRYIGLVIPCLGAGTQADPNPPAMVALAGAAMEARMPIAAQYSGIDLLVLTGRLKGRRYARNLLFAGADTPSGVVVDGSLATSGTCPLMAREFGQQDGTGELMTRFIALLPAQR